MADGMDDMENQSRQDNICVLKLKGGKKSHAVLWILTAHYAWFRGEPWY